MPRQHFSRNLRITRLVSPDQAKGGKSPQEEKTAACEQQKPIGDSETIIQSI